MLSGLWGEQAQDGGPLQDVDEVIAFIAHFLVPSGSIGVPGSQGFEVGAPHFVRTHAVSPILARLECEEVKFDASG